MTSDVRGLDTSYRPESCDPVPLFLGGHEGKRLVNDEFLGILDDNVGDHARALREFDHRHVIRQAVFERRMKRAMEYHPADQLGLARCIVPGPVRFQTLRAFAACRQPVVAALAAMLERELAFLQRVPIRL